MEIIAQAMRSMPRRVRGLRAEDSVRESKIEGIVKTWRPDLLDLVDVGPIIAATILTV